MPRPTTCADCGAPLPPPTPGPGRPRRWCSEACRKRAWRRRKAAVVDWTAPDLPEPVLTPWRPSDGFPVAPRPTDTATAPEEQLARAVLELYTTAGILRDLARRLGRAQLRYRAEELARRLTAALDDLLPPV